MAELKLRFPFFRLNPNLIYLDNAATTQRVDRALDASWDYYHLGNANVHRGLYPLAEKATIAYEGVRDMVKDFINAREREEIIFTKGTTESLNLVVQSWGSKFLKSGDEIVLTILEHHSNLVPWQMVAKKTGAVLRFCPIKKNGQLDYDALAALITPKTKIVSITGLSNVLGTVVDIKQVVRLARKVGALVCVDAAQFIAHFAIDVQQLDVDFLAFSSHKIYGPTGCGVLYAKKEHLLEMEPWMGGGDMIKEVYLDHSIWNDLPWKFEAGTPAISQVIGLGGALSFLTELGFTWIKQHDQELQDYALVQMRSLSGVTLFGSGDWQTQRGAISFAIQGIHPHDVAAVLGEKGICVRAGHHCCMPLISTLGVPATVRMSFAIYNSKEDVDFLVDGLKSIQRKFR
ncbi:TPA: cysteine desulfurase [Candidatus Peregrinibacteria bacterium]|nr:cysteine desulfurase [Candidatus Peregrinibacteria bacterium]